MNKIQILGTITRNPEIKYTQSGAAICSFGIAYNDTYLKDGNKVDKAHFFDVTAFGKTGENINKYFHAGSRILIDGSLSYEQWEKDGQKRSKVGIKLNGFDFIDRKSDNENQGTQQPRQQQERPAHAQVPDLQLDDSEVPF